MDSPPGCRRCVILSHLKFNSFFERIDRRRADGEIEKIGPSIMMCRLDASTSSRNDNNAHHPTTNIRIPVRPLAYRLRSNLEYI